MRLRGLDRTDVSDSVCTLTYTLVSTPSVYNLLVPNLYPSTRTLHAHAGRCLRALGRQANAVHLATELPLREGAPAARVLYSASSKAGGDLQVRLERMTCPLWVGKSLVLVKAGRME